MRNAPTVMPGLGSRIRLKDALPTISVPIYPAAMPKMPADAADHAGLDQKLGDNAFALCADGLADTDLPGALGHGDQHDVHDPDAAAHRQGDGGDAAQEALLHLVLFFHALLDLVGGVGVAVALSSALSR